MACTMHTWPTDLNCLKINTKLSSIHTYHHHLQKPKRSRFHGGTPKARQPLIGPVIAKFPTSLYKTHVGPKYISIPEYKFWELSSGSCVKRGREGPERWQLSDRNKPLGPDFLFLSI